MYKWVGRHLSRILPLSSLTRTFATDPWEFDSSGEDRKFVFLRDRKTKADLRIDWNHSTPQSYQRKLEIINRVNAEHEITFHPFDKWDERFLGQRRLRPVHYAIFTDDWDHHGRIYTGKYGHQGLRGFERQLIRMARSPSVETDYSGFHPCLAYHLEGIDYEDDPYALWGDDWGGNSKMRGPLRLMAKKVINAALNAENDRATIAACNLAMSPFTEKGNYKSGKAGEEAKLLREAKEKTGLQFSEIYKLAREQHQPIAHRFGSDAGMEFMNIDGWLALEILHSFAEDGIPCLGIHDSFIVPAEYKDRLSDEMTERYRRITGFKPHLKSVSSPPS